jgi:hypothetical protein
LRASNCVITRKPGCQRTVPSLLPSLIASVPIILAVR